MTRAEEERNGGGCKLASSSPKTHCNRTLGNRVTLLLFRLPLFANEEGGITSISVYSTKEEEGKGGGICAIVRGVWEEGGRFAWEA